MAARVLEIYCQMVFVVVVVLGSDKTMDSIDRSAFLAPSKLPPPLVGHAGGGDCPVCAPSVPQRPDVMIPFYERDLCKLKYTAKSISKNDPDHNFGDIYLLWVSRKSSSKYKKELRDIIKSLSSTHKVHFLDMTSQLEESRPNPLDPTAGGWVAQQIVKLKMASVVRSEYYVVLDSKNSLVGKLKPDTLFTTCNLAKIQGYPLKNISHPHSDWYKSSAATLGLAPPESGYWPGSITPVVLHRQTVLDMLHSLGESSNIKHLCGGPLCDALHNRENRSTEFTLYALWATSRPDFACRHNVQELHSDFDAWAATIWRGQPDAADREKKRNFQILERLVAEKDQTLMFGAQAGALDLMDTMERARATELIVQLYSQANMFDSSVDQSDTLIDCVVGSFNLARPTPLNLNTSRLG